MNVAISWLFLMYFAVLGTERIRSLFPVGSGGFFATPFDGYVNLMTVLSLTATLVLLIGFNGGFWRSLFGGATPNYRAFCFFREWFTPSIRLHRFSLSHMAR